MAVMGVLPGGGATGAVWAAVAGDMGGAANVLWQNVGSHEVEIFFSGSAVAPAATVKGLLLLPKAGYVDVAGSAYVYARSGNASCLVAVKD